ncbi:hypothetical protein BDV96DRAFT_597586 [Lophiotrema nucula]|uniref:BTB domain-containing protein n=1 Tax=Lophiotrema nucula TaxID=690887 RepID=A0A6A5ZEQ6_9PLEO|nr:hypothetical protein BDV96DRAFT_597586 [Lophiotrema nucula]
MAGEDNTREFSFLIDRDLSGTDLDLVHFQVGPQKWAVPVHKTLLQQCGFDYTTFPKITPSKIPQWHLSTVNPTVFRGFLDWLYRQKLVSDETIKQSVYPSEWQNDKEKEPLGVSLAYELATFAHRYGIKQLKNDTMTFIFRYYKTSSSLPTLARIRQVFDHMSESVPLARFIIDIHFNLGHIDTSDVLTSIDELPVAFLKGVFHRKCFVNTPRMRQEAKVKRVKPTTSANAKALWKGYYSPRPSAVPSKDGWVMQLCDYHVHSEDEKPCCTCATDTEKSTIKN